jgi:hypothetical protein
MTRQSTVACWQNGPSYCPEIVLGRMLAACAHPFAAWQLLSISWRVSMLAAYAAIGFFTVLSALLF